MAIMWFDSPRPPDHSFRVSFRLVDAILHHSNVEFIKGKEVDSSLLKDEKSKFHLKMTAELLMCDRAALEDALLKRVMVTPEEVIKRSLNPEATTISRDGLAKTLYCGYIYVYVYVSTDANQIMQIENKEIEPDEEPPRGIVWLKGRVNKDGQFPDDEIRSVGDKLV
ncbi:IQ motif, EF-hand binding site containing protein [Tanacetum coccineum]